MSSLNWEAMKARTFQLHKVWEVKCGKTCGWMDLLVGAGVSTAALRIVQYGPNPSLRQLNLCGQDAYSKEKSPHGFYIRSPNGKDIVTIQLNKLHCSDCSQSTPK